MDGKAEFLQLHGYRDNKGWSQPKLNRVWEEERVTDIYGFDFTQNVFPFAFTTHYMVWVEAKWTEKLSGEVYVGVGGTVSNEILSCDMASNVKTATRRSKKKYWQNNPELHAFRKKYNSEPKWKLTEVLSVVLIIKRLVETPE